MSGYCSLRFENVCALLDWVFIGAFLYCKHATNTTPIDTNYDMTGSRHVYHYLASSHVLTVARVVDL